MVVDSRYCVVGVITRVDILNISATVNANMGLDGSVRDGKGANAAKLFNAERRMEEAAHQIDRLMRSTDSSVHGGDGSNHGKRRHSHSTLLQRRQHWPDGLYDS